MSTYFCDEAKMWWPCRMRGTVVMLLAVVALAPAVAYAAETTDLDGSAFVFVPGDPVKVVDITQPYVPLEVATIPIQSWELSQVPVNGNTYLVAMGTDDILHIWDVTVPYRPVPVSSLPAPIGDGPPEVTDVDWAEADGRTFALISAGDSIHVIEVTDPQNPSRTGEIRNGERRIDALGGVVDAEQFWADQMPYLIVAGSDAVQIIGFDVPTKPEGISVIRQGEYGFGTVGGLLDVDIAASESGVYALIMGAHSVMVADITDPGHPVHVDTFVHMNLVDMDVLQTEDASYALAMCIDKMHIIDMRDPNRPVEISDIPISTADVAGIETDGRLWALSVGETVDALDITNPESPMPAYVREGGFSYTPEATEIAVIGGDLYVLTASVGRSTIQITEITDPANPVPVSAVVGGQHAHGIIHGPHDVAVTEADGRTYAVVPNAYSNSMAILDITDPRSPTIESNVEFPTLRVPTSVAIFDSGSSKYAAVAGHYAESIRLLDITDPGAPVLGVLIRDGQYGFEAVGDPLSLDAVTIGDSSYILVSSYFENAVQIIDVTDPDSPVPAAALFDRIDGYALGGPHEIKAVQIGGETFAVVAAAYDSSISIIDITDPRSPSLASRMTDGRGGFDYLDTVQYLDVVSHGDRTLLVATSYFDHTVQLADITDPRAPEPLPSAAQGQDGFDALVGPTDVAVASHGGIAYVAVADYFGNGIQIAEIDGLSLKAASTVSAGLQESLPLAITTGVQSATISGRTYALTASPAQDVVQITDITNPTTPTAVSLIRHGEDGFVMDGPAGIEVGEISGGHYAFVAGVDSEGVQVVDISEPDDPKPIYLMRDGLGWVVETEFLLIDRIPYLVMADRTSDTLHIMDVSDPAGPERVAVLPDVISSAQGVDVIRTAEKVLALVFSFDHHTVHIIDITDPANPHQVSAISGEKYLQAVTDLDSITIGTRTLSAISSYKTDTVSVVDITDPLNPVLLSSVQGGEGGHYLHSPESLQVAAIGDGVFVAVANGNDSLQLMDITDPLRPVLAAPIGMVNGSSIYGTTDVEMVKMGADWYVLFQTIDGNITPLLDITDPYEPVDMSLIPPLHHLEQLK